jgi:putative tryptophan/tyrosine transport system substrate-binding protein
MRSDRLRRREFLGVLGGAVAWPLTARAQQSAMLVVGYLSPRVEGADPDLLAAFRQGLKDFGYVEGQSVAIEYRFAAGQYDRLPGMAADLVRRQVAVIAAPGGPPTVLAAKAATATIPIVFLIGSDPVEMGLVAGLKRPGGNITGVVTLNVELAPKRLELLRELAPSATTMALLVNPTNPSAAAVSRDVQAAARVLGIELHVLHASTEGDFDRAFAAVAQRRAGALIIGTDVFFNSRAQQLGSLALRHRVPAIYQYREFVAAGGLASYGGSLTDLFYQVGAYTGRILKGDKPAELPVQQATKAELIINLDTAKALGVTVPLALLARADEAIE